MRVQSQFIEMFGDPVTNSKGWETGKIKDVAPETPSKKQLSGKVWLLNLDMIESNTGKVIEKVYENVENALSVQPFDEDNVLFSKLRPYLNKVVIPNEVGLATTELVPLRPNPSKLNKVFLSHLLRSDQFVNYADDIAGGTKMPRMPLSELRNFECILPPMDTQMQFVFIAEQADKSKFVSFKSQFIEMFGDVEKKPFVDVCISKGEYGSNSPADDYDGNIRYVRITDITEEGNLNGVVVSPRKVEEKYMLLQDDLLFARTGNTVGKTYLHKSGKMVFAGYLIRYRLNKKLMLPQFAFAYTHTNQYYDWVEKIKKVGAQPNISAAQYDSMPILVPSMAKQIEFVAIAKQADKSKYYN